MIRVRYIPELGCQVKPCIIAGLGGSSPPPYTGVRRWWAKRPTTSPSSSLVMKWTGWSLETRSSSPLSSLARCAEDRTLEVVLLRWYEGVEPPELGEEVLDG